MPNESTQPSPILHAKPDTSKRPSSVSPQTQPPPSKKPKDDKIALSDPLATTELIVGFGYVVHGIPTLWDKQSPKYYLKDWRADAWERACEVLREMDFCQSILARLTPSFCRQTYQSFADGVKKQIAEYRRPVGKSGAEYTVKDWTMEEQVHHQFYMAYGHLVHSADDIADDLRSDYGGDYTQRLHDFKTSMVDIEEDYQDALRIKGEEFEAVVDAQPTIVHDTASTSSTTTAATDIFNYDANMSLRDKILMYQQKYARDGLTAVQYVEYYELKNRVSPLNEEERASLEEQKHIVMHNRVLVNRHKQIALREQITRMPRGLSNIEKRQYMDDKRRALELLYDSKKERMQTLVLRKKIAKEEHEAARDEYRKLQLGQGHPKDLLKRITRMTALVDAKYVAKREKDGLHLDTVLDETESEARAADRARAQSKSRRQSKTAANEQVAQEEQEQLDQLLKLASYKPDKFDVFGSLMTELMREKPNKVANDLMADIMQLVKDAPDKSPIKESTVEGDSSSATTTERLSKSPSSPRPRSPLPSRSPSPSPPASPCLPLTSPTTSRNQPQRANTLTPQNVLQKSPPKNWKASFSKAKIDKTDKLLMWPTWAVDELRALFNTYTEMGQNSPALDLFEYCQSKLQAKRTQSQVKSQLKLMIDCDVSPWLLKNLSIGDKRTRTRKLRERRQTAAANKENQNGDEDEEINEFYNNDFPLHGGEENMHDVESYITPRQPQVEQEDVVKDNQLNFNKNYYVNLKVISQEGHETNYENDVNHPARCIRIKSTF